MTSIDPVIGSADGGTKITVTGTNFGSVDYVSVGDKHTVAFTVNSDTSLTVTDPGGGPATVDVVVTNAGGSSATSAGTKFAWDPNELTDLSLSVDAVKAGSPAPGKIALKYPARASGITIPVRWNSTPPGSTAAVVPATLLVGPGLSAANFQITTLFTSAPHQIRLTIDHGFVTRTAAFTINP